MVVEAGSQGSAKARLSVGTVDAYGGDWLVAATGPRAGRRPYFPSHDAPNSNHGVAQGLDFDRSTSCLPACAVMARR